MYEYSEREEESTQCVRMQDSRYSQLRTVTVTEKCTFPAVSGSVCKWVSLLVCHVCKFSSCDFKLVNDQLNRVR